MKKILFILFFSGFIFPAFSQDNASIFLKFSDDAIKGDSYQQGFEGFVEALSVSYGVSNPVVASGGIGGPGAAGNPSFSDFSFFHNVSLNSPIFNLYVANGKHIQKVEIFFWKMSPKGTMESSYKVTLEDVVITSISTATNTDCNLCSVGVESISLNYSKITWEDLENNVKTSWDISTTKAG